MKAPSHSPLTPELQSLIDRGMLTRAQAESVNAWAEEMANRDLSEAEAEAAIQARAKADAQAFIKMLQS